MKLQFPKSMSTFLDLYNTKDVVKMSLQRLYGNHIVPSQTNVVYDTAAIVMVIYLRLINCENLFLDCTKP